MVAENRLRFFEDLIALKIMLLLYRDNPNVPFEILQKELRLDRGILSAKLAELIKVELVKIETNDKNQLYTLSDNARMAFNRINVLGL